MLGHALNLLACQNGAAEDDQRLQDENPAVADWEAAVAALGDNVVDRYYGVKDVASAVDDQQGLEDLAGGEQHGRKATPRR